MTHKEMLDILWNNPSLIQQAMSWSSIWVRGREFYYDPTSKEHADMVVQNQYHSGGVQPGTICCVIEVKSRQANHEVQGQLAKAVDALTRVGQQTKMWESTTGIAIAPKYTASALKLIQSSGFHALEWQGHSGFSRLIHL